MVSLSGASPKTLLTSFTIWKPHHRSNASDDLLGELLQCDRRLTACHFLRRLPVDAELATALVIGQIQWFQPDLLICCGMAETREKLSLELQAVRDEQVLQTNLALEPLIEGLQHSEMSDDAGRFVCNHLYYSVLDYLHRSPLAVGALFVHVPLLHDGNRAAIAQDFLTLLERLQVLP